MSSEQDMVAMIRKLLEGQKKLTERVNALEQRVSTASPLRASDEGLTPALVRVLASLKKVGGESDARELEEKLDVARPMVSSYLNRLSEMGYVEKLRNPYGERRARYLFRLAPDRLPPKIRKEVERG